MQPSSDASGAPKASSLRRYGPIGAILAVVVLVAAAAVVLSDGDDDDEEDDVPAASDIAEGELPDGVVTWSMAQDDDLDVSFPDTCDPSTGKVAIPFFFRTECTADVDDNGGATADGVTADEITVVAWLPNPDDTIYSFLRQAMGFDDTVEEIRETQEGLVEIFQAYYQTYGRTVRLEFVEASGQMLDTVAARADAVRALEQEPFAVLGGPLTAGTWTEELDAESVPCVVCPGISEPELAFGLTPTQSQLREHVVQYVTNKLDGKPVEFADDDLVGEERVFGLLKLAQGEGDQRHAERLGELLEDEGVELAASSTFDLNLGATQENATAAVNEMVSADVTTVLVDADPINLAAITEEATKQDWYPEWVLAGPTLLDTNVGGAMQDPAQWEHAFGISWLPPAAVPEANPAYRLYEWYHGEPPPAEGSLLLTYPQIALFFTGVAFAGPELTPETFRQALFAYPPTPRAVTQPSVDYGTELWGRNDYGGIDDLVELWWDPDAEGVDEFGNPVAGGQYQYVDGGRRYYVDEWTDELRVFDPEGAITTITEPPEEEAPPDYPPP